MEIITYVRDGAVSHRDSLGNEGASPRGDVLAMSAGTGVQHEEFNHERVTLHIFQIWIKLRIDGGAPAWGTKAFPRHAQKVALPTLVATGRCTTNRSDPRRRTLDTSLEKKVFQVRVSA
jgi:redox-sensitive bicupin YhaK (pirin superfamily)